MARFAPTWGVLILGTLVPLAPAADDPADRTNSDTLLTFLRAPNVTIPEVPADWATSFVDVLKGISDKFSRPGDNPPFFLRFRVNVPAFKADGVKDFVKLSPVAERPFPKVENVTMSWYLGQWLERIPSKSGATFILRRDHIEITTKAALRQEVWGERRGPYLPLVYARFEKKPLADALQDLARQTEYSIVVDARVEDRMGAKITAHFRWTALDTAVFVLADMADLQPVSQDNALYITTRENAARINARNKAKMPTKNTSRSPERTDRPAPAKGASEESSPPCAPADGQAEDSAFDLLLDALHSTHGLFEEVPEDPMTTFRGLLTSLSLKHSRPNANPPFHLHFRVNEAAFKAEEVMDVNEFQIVKDKVLPASRNLSLAEYLPDVLEHVPSRSGTTFVLRRDHIEITTRAALRKEIWGGREGRYLPLVSGRFVKKPMADVLQDLARQTNYSVVVDVRVEEKASKKVTAQFLSTPLDTAVSLLADMAGLEHVIRDNLIYVTTPENAKRIKTEHQRPGEGKAPGKRQK
jgi:hypothetical protein